MNDKNYHDGKYYFQRVLIVFFCLFVAACFGGLFYTCTQTGSLYFFIHIGCGAVCILGLLFSIVKTIHAVIK